MRAAFKLDAVQIEKIIDDLVPVIAAPEDYEFFRGILTIKAEESSASAFGAFVKTLLDAN
jgi:hypothetical protein